jgi:hypothetical protein
MQQQICEWMSVGCSANVRHDTPQSLRCNVAVLALRLLRGLMHQPLIVLNCKSGLCWN